MSSRIRAGLFLFLAFCLVQATESFTLPFSPRQAPSFVGVPCNKLDTNGRLIERRSNGHGINLILASSASNKEIVSVEAEDIFLQNCDSDGLMTKKMVQNLDFVAEMMKEGDLIQAELDQLWEGAPKFPDSDEERIDVDSFVQIYRDIDDLFEDDEEEKEEKSTVSLELQDDSNNDDDDELKNIFQSIATDKGVLSKQALLRWKEVKSLLDDGLFDEEEFDGIWKSLPKADHGIGIAGFLKFNKELDNLFEFDDEEVEGGEEESAEAEVTAQVDTTTIIAAEELAMIEDEDLSPAELFNALADSGGLVGKDELKRWGELQEMLKEEDLMPLELENIYDSIAKADENKLNKEGFLALYNKIDSLFEDEEGDDEPAVAEPAASGTKEQLLATVASFNSDEERLPCGLESTELEQKYVLELVTALESESSNMVRERQGAIEMSDLAGEWELLYTSSAAMAYNKGLSGLGGSFPNGKFGGLKMKLIASKFLTDVEYTERINVTPDTASFDVSVNGSWELRSSVSIFTGEPSIALTVVPERVTYGPTSTRADHWKSLGPTNMLDVSYLDDNLRVMRGNTSTDSILIFKRTQ
ncbi:expressed unknown protein [Seminavis robusta]|uniref:Plastid lipid-associated protein/fibrillin conserved domain-containing protein n=1 Tax=Seminavis robusta TaxID=568900 RepID=A0A9N8F0C3_9STRA|nr:expressed unknown protein [Seminavis robusta]|eukprot:Sro2131_g315880.1 n/a (586) ;mRNA; f:6222-8298